jgi:membrane protein insertase Oxa1/YidC/SpoIIIJ
LLKLNGAASIELIRLATGDKAAVAVALAEVFVVVDALVALTGGAAASIFAVTASILLLLLPPPPQPVKSTAMTQYVNVIQCLIFVFMLNPFSQLKYLRCTEFQNEIFICHLC